MTVPAEPAGRLRVALVQTAPRLGAVGDNLADLRARLDRVADADIAVAPELATHGYHLAALDDPGPLPADDPGLLALGDHGPAVVAGFAEADGPRTCNSAALVDRGRIAVQRKLYLVQYRDWVEGDQFHPGDRLDCHDVRGARVAVLVCNDLWQPQVPWLAAHSGAEVLLVIANSATSAAAVPVQRAWDALITHAAVVLQSYVVFVNRVGEECGDRFWGGSCAVGPDGAVLARFGEEPCQAVVDLDLASLRALRAEWPLLAESRFDLVAAECARRVAGG